MTSKYITSMTNTSIFYSIHSKNRTMRWFKILFVITFIGVFKLRIMLSDFKIFSNTMFFICLMHQIPTSVIRCVISIHCYDWLIYGWRQRGIRLKPRTFYPNYVRDQLINDYKNKNELKFKNYNFEIQRRILRQHKI